MSENSFQNSSIAFNVPYKAFLSLTYYIGSSFLLWHIYFLYSLVSNLVINSTIVPSNSIWKSSVMSACRKMHVMSVTNMYLPSLASNAHGIFIDYNETVWELVSSLVVYSLYDCPSAHPPGLIIPSCLLLRNFRYLSAGFHSSYVMFSFFFDNSGWCSCSWVLFFQ